MTAARKRSDLVLGDDAPDDAPDDANAVLSDELDFADEWEDEVERRAGELRAGEAKGIPWEDADAEIKARFGWV